MHHGFPHTCPVCGFPDLTEPARGTDGGGSYEICPSCGFQFGVTDDDRSVGYAEWRTAWQRRGMPWASVGQAPPAGWDPARQLLRLESGAMTRRQRLLTALRVGIPDRVPLFDFLFQQPMYVDLIGRRPENYNGRDALECALALNHDGVWLPFGGFSGYRPEFLAPNVYRDEWGTTYRKEAASWPIDAPIEYPVRTRADLAGFRLPDPTRPGRDAEILAARDANRDDLALLGGVQGPLTTAWLLMGFENICYALHDDPSLLTEVFRLSNEFFKEAARRSVAAGCVGIWVSEDLGDSHRGFFKLTDYRKYVLPPFVELVDFIDALGVPVLLHSCGCIKSFLDDLAQTRIASVHPLQRTAKMDLAEVKRSYGKRFCLIGNIDSSRTLPFGTPAEVEAEARQAIDVAAPGGGYILASDHSLHDGIPVANIRALAKAGTEYGGAFYRKSSGEG